MAGEFYYLALQWHFVVSMKTPWKWLLIGLMVMGKWEK